MQVEAEDRHGNKGRITALERSNFYGHVASEYGSDSIYNEEIAVGAGLLSGFSVGAGESAATIEAMANDPFGFIDSLTNILDLLDKLGMLDHLIRALHGAIDRQQEVTNPYDKKTQPTLHGEFRKGWYGGYAEYFLLTMVVGAEKVVKVAKKSSTLTDLVEKLDSNGKLRKTAKLLKRSQRVTPKDRTTTYAVTRADGYGMDGAEVIEDIGTAAKRADLVENGLSKVDSKIYDALDEDGATRLGKFLVRKGDDEIIESINKLDPDTARKIFSTSADDIGVGTKRMTRVRVSIIRATNTERLSSKQAREMMEHLEEVKGLDGDVYKSFARKLENGDPQLVRSTKWELERAAHYRKRFDDSEITIEPLDDEVDIKVDGQYIEQKAITHGSVNLDNFDDNQLGKVQESFQKNHKEMGSSPTKAEIDIRELDDWSQKERKRLEEIIVEYSKTRVNKNLKTNHIDEVEVFLPDGTSIKAVKNDKGIFEVTS